MISGEDIERAERILMSSAWLAVVPGPRALLNRAGIQEDAVEQFMRKCRADVRGRQPDLDPRYEPTIMTELRHALLVGVMAGRRDEKGRP